jgi:hypothetical protein
MNIEEKLKKLSEIKQVDAPPFLFTKIEQSIKNLQEKKVKPIFKFAYAGLATSILILNITVIIQYYKVEKKNNLEVLVQNMQLQNQNNFYHEQN